MDELKKESRRRADRLRRKFEALGEPLSWFEAIYAEASGEPRLVPWGHMEARFPLVNWLENQTPDVLSGRALDIGCGLGDNAMVLADAGFDVTAFDISETAVKWASKRFPVPSITWRSANLLDPPAEWTEAFDLVSETFTIQALKGRDRTRAFEGLPNFVKPGGRLLIVARGRLEDEPINPPPWPLTNSELDGLEHFGLKSIAREEYFDKKDPPQRHFLAEFIKPTLNAV